MTFSVVPVGLLVEPKYQILEGISLWCGQCQLILLNGD